MNWSEVLNDKTLSALGGALFVLVLWVRGRSPSARVFKEEPLWVTLPRIACGLVLVGASLDKIGDAQGFYGTLQECYFLPQALQPLIAVVIPWVELFTGLCLLLRFRWRAAALLFCALMAVYTLAVAWDASQGIDCNCGCFDKGSTEKLSWFTVLRDLSFLALGLPLLEPSSGGRRKDP